MDMLKKRFVRILESFGVPKFEIPGNLNQFDEKINEINGNLKDIKNVAYFYFGYHNLLKDCKNDRSATRLGSSEIL